MFHCPVGVWVIEQHAIISSATVRSPTVLVASWGVVSRPATFLMVTLMETASPTTWFASMTRAKRGRAWWALAYQRCCVPPGHTASLHLKWMAPARVRCFSMTRLAAGVGTVISKEHCASGLQLVRSARSARSAVSSQVRCRNFRSS